MANYRMNKIAIGDNTYECAEWYGSCSSSATTKVKLVGIIGFSSAQLVDGVRVVVKFTNGQSYSGIPQLNVSNTGAKYIMVDGNRYAGQYEWEVGQIVAFVYYNDTWVVEDGGHATTNYWGKTKLSNTIADDQTTALTPKAVYDAGYLTLSTLPIWDGSVT